MESRRRCTGKVEGDLVIFLFPSQCGRYGSADHRFDYFVSVSDVFVTLVYVGHAAAVYIALHAALDDILVCGHDTGSFVAYLPQARGQRYAAAREELDRLFAELSTRLQGERR